MIAASRNMSTSPLHEDESRLTASNNCEYREPIPVKSAGSQATGRRSELQAILKRAMDVTEATGAAIALSTEEGVFCEVSTGTLAPDVGTPLYAGVGLAGRCLSTGEIQLCNQANADSRLDPGVSEALGIGSVLMLPIKQSSRVLGVLGLLSHKPNAFRETQVAVAGGLADRVSSLVSGFATLRYPPHNLVEPRTTTQGFAHTVDLQRLLEAAYVLQDKDRLGNMDTAETREPRYPSPRLSECVPAASGMWSRVRALDTPGDWPVIQPDLSAWAAAITRLWNRIPTLGMPQSPSGRLLALAVPALLVVFVLLGRLTFLSHSQPASLQTTAIADVTRSSDKPVATHSPDLRTPGHTSSAVLNNRGGSSSAIDHGNIQNIEAAQDHSTGKMPDTPPATDLASAQAVQEIDGDGPPDTAPLIATLPVSVSDSRLGFLSTPVSLPRAEMDVSEGVAGGKLLRQVNPVYPAAALAQRLEGWVVLRGVVAENGTIQDLNAVSGHPLLARAALDAVTRWLYQPYRLNGKKIRMPMEIKLKFKLP
jgi:TonB family protein